MVVGARVGVMGNPHHPASHVEALRGLGVPETDIARVRRPIGLDIGSRTPPEIAIAPLAGLGAERTGRPGGFDSTTPAAVDSRATRG
ncbi:protein of unknown function DUF182 [Actinokineospora spheciospongiae]|uniref:XdhC Rossmann domain-containing protein n=1 Tax=Actinokineospora spheciospongiae TaxID=909613 RepID=W7IR20_9PSEU|nr:protein of unknown function DUF182 [Actinokineospora spheciospongiae]